jgi:tRNA A37 threonylcarbamoyladenosine biosynthesis protein TsaE
LYQIEDQTEFVHLGIEQTLFPGNILCFEWGEKSAEIIDVLQKNAKVIYVEMEYVNEKEREIRFRI